MRDYREYLVLVFVCYFLIEYIFVGNFSVMFRLYAYISSVCVKDVSKDRL